MVLDGSIKAKDDVECRLEECWLIIQAFSLCYIVANKMAMIS